MALLRAAGWQLKESRVVTLGEEVVMIPCLDIHTHHPAPQPQAVVAISFSQEFNPIEGQLYSIGIHPWESDKHVTSTEWELFEKYAAHPQVAAIGECGIDKVKGPLLFKQLLVMNKQIEISEKLHKPLIIHDVKAHDIIVGLKRDLKPEQKWLVHGFRGKPSVAKMLLDAGIFLSFGEKFNPETPAIVPPEMILAETDESSLSILEIIKGLSDNLDRDITPEIIANTSRFLFNSI